MAADPGSIRDALRITCADAIELMTEHLEGALGPADRERFDQHLRGCEACAVYLDQIRMTVTVVHGVGREDTVDVEPETMASLVEAFRARG